MDKLTQQIARTKARLVKLEQKMEKRNQRTYGKYCNAYYDEKSKMWQIFAVNIPGENGKRKMIYITRVGSKEVAKGTVQRMDKVIDLGIEYYKSKETF